MRSDKLAVRLLVSCLLVLATVWCVNSRLTAQTVNGSFHGTVIDSTGAVVPAATVQVKNLATNQVRQAVTDSVGYYTITQLAPGSYDVDVSKTGFASVHQSGVELLVNQDLEANYTVSLGQ